MSKEADNYDGWELQITRRIEKNKLDRSGQIVKSGALDVTNDAYSI